MALQRSSGWWLGPLVINYGLIVFILVLPLLAAGFMGWLSLKWAIGLAVFSGLVVPFLLYRWSWSLWLMIYYVLLPHELPANNSNFDLIDNE